MRNWIFLFFIIIVTITLLNSCQKPTLEAQQEAQDAVRAINISQIAFLYEENRFANSIEELKISDKINTHNYDYSIFIDNKVAFNYAIPHSNNLKSYAGGVYFDPTNTNQSTEETSKPYIPSILCEANIAGKSKPELPTIENGAIRCGKGTTQIGT